MENRKYPRINIDSLMADISDGKGFFIGNIDNVSRFGISVSDLPKQLDEQASMLTAIVSGRGENFKMFLKPKWDIVTGDKKRLGLEIESCSWGWTDFIMNLESERMKDDQSSIN